MKFEIHLVACGLRLSGEPALGWHLVVGASLLVAPFSVRAPSECVRARVCRPQVVVAAAAAVSSIGAGIITPE
jgi:hypothetical protein